MNKRIINRYKKILESITGQSKEHGATDLLNISVFETQELFSKLVRSDYLVYNFLNEEQAFMITYFSYLVCKNDMENIIQNIIEHINKNAEYFDIKVMDIRNFEKGMELYQYYPDSYTFKRNLLDMIIENKVKFLKTYKIQEILNLKKFI
jgi:hypothetical protein